MAWDWSAIGAVVGGFSTLIYTGFTYALLRENRALRKAGSEPRVVAHFEPHSAGNGALQLALSNVGKGPALNVLYSFEYESGDFENYDLLFKYSTERPAITMIEQGEKFSFTFAIGFRLFSPKDHTISRRLKPFFVNVKWHSVDNKKIYSEKYLLDVSAYEGLPGIIEKPPIVEISDELKNIQKTLAKLANNQDYKSTLIDTTSIEQRVRSVRPVKPPDPTREPR